MDAARNLGETRARYAVPKLIAALDDPDQYVRSWAAWALGQIGDRDAIDPLINSLSKYEALLRSDRLRQQTKCLPDIYTALERITGKHFGLDVDKWRTWAREKTKGEDKGVGSRY